MTIKNIVLKKKSFYFLILFCIAAILFLFYILFKGELRFFDIFEYSDIHTYIRVLESGSYHERLNSLKYNDFLSFSLSEPLWSGIVVFLNSFFNSDTIFVFIIPLFIVLLSSSYVYYNSNFLYLIFLLHPISTGFQLNQLRLALAISLFLFATVFIKNNKRVFLFSILTVFIHTSMAIFLSMFYVCQYLCVKESLSNFKKFLILVFMGFCMAYITGPAIGDFLSYLGDWRANHYSGDKWQTSLYTSLYCFVFVVLFGLYYKSREVVIGFSACVSIIFFSLVGFSYFFIGGYPMRYLSAVFPILIVSGYQFNDFYKKIYFIMFFVIGIYILLT